MMKVAWPGMIRKLEFCGPMWKAFNRVAALQKDIPWMMAPRWILVIKTRNGWGWRIRLSFKTVSKWDSGGFWLPAVGWRLPASSCRLPAAGCRLPNPDSRFPILHYRLLGNNHLSVKFYSVGEFSRNNKRGKSPLEWKCYNFRGKE